MPISSHRRGAGALPLSLFSSSALGGLACRRTAALYAGYVRAGESAHSLLLWVFNSQKNSSLSLGKLWTDLGAASQLSQLRDLRVSATLLTSCLASFYKAAVVHLQRKLSSTLLLSTK